MIEYEIHRPEYPEVLETRFEIKSLRKIFTYNMQYLYMLLNLHQYQRMVLTPKRKIELWMKIFVILRPL